MSVHTSDDPTMIPNMYTDFTRHDKNPYFYSDEPPTSLYTDFSYAYISVLEYNMFLPVNHSKLLQISEYYRTALTWTHGLATASNSSFSLPSGVLQLQPIFSDLALTCFTSLVNDEAPLIIPDEDQIQLVSICAYLGIDSSWLSGQLPEPHDLPRGYLRHVFVYTLYDSGYPSLAEFYSLPHQYRMLTQTMSRELFLLYSQMLEIEQIRRS